MGGRLLAGTPSVRPSNTVKSVAVAVTGRGSRKNTVGQAWGSRRGEWDGHLRETHPGPRRHTRDTQGRMGPCGHRAMRTQKRIRGGGGGYKGQRNGDGQARSRDSPGGLLPHNTQALGLQGRMSRGGRRQLAAVPHGARRWAPEQGPAGGGGARGLGLNFALWVSVVDVAADSSSVHPCRQRRKVVGCRGGRALDPRPPGHTHPWVRRVFHSRACGSRAGHRAGGGTGTERGLQSSPPAPPAASPRPLTRWRGRGLGASVHPRAPTLATRGQHPPAGRTHARAALPPPPPGRGRSRPSPPRARLE